MSTHVDKSTSVEVFYRVIAGWKVGVLSVTGSWGYSEKDQQEEDFSE
jgi:hypothetical protein